MNNCVQRSFTSALCPSTQCFFFFHIISLKFRSSFKKSSSHFSQTSLRFLLYYFPQSFFKYLHEPYTSPYLTSTHLIHITLPYTSRHTLPQLTLRITLPYLNSPYTLPYLTSTHLTPYVIPYLTFDAKSGVTVPRMYDDWNTCWRMTLTDSQTWTVVRP